ncbi:MAG: hypothetical protein LBR99_03400 [Treponema sp.]|jgi:hypothetical protein|nr:hypothetical protein [Treponema sp.]
MKRYYIKSGANQSAYFDIKEEREDGYRIRITRIIDGYEKVSDDFMNNDLFTLCIKTGYIREIPREDLSARPAASSVA